MSSNWKNNYADLLDYIAQHPRIEISKKSVVLLDDVRPGFYQLFDDVRTSFVKDKFPAELEQGAILGNNWRHARQDLIDRLKLDSLDIQGATNWFLLDPVDGLMRDLFEPLFNLLKKEIDLVAFEQEAIEIGRINFTNFVSDGYRRLATVSLINMLLPDELYSVPARDFYSDPVIQEGDLDNGLHEENLPDIVPTSRILFEQPLLCSFLTPRIIIHSARLGRYVAFRPDCCEARWKARRLSPKQEWFSISEIEEKFGNSRFWPDMFIFSASDKADLTLVADYHQIARPDIIIEFREEGDWYQKEGLEVIRRHHDSFKPKLGSFVICREPVPEAAFKDLNTKPVIQPVNTEESVPNPLISAEQSSEKTATVELAQAAETTANIQLIYVGDNMAKLESVINAIT
jgi:hypothetical protein